MSKRSIGIAFGAGLVIFIGLNAGLTLLAQAVAETLDLYLERIGDYPIMVLELIFGSIKLGPAENFFNIFSASGSSALADIVEGLAFLLPGIIAGIAIGLLSESKWEALGAWILIAVIAVILDLIAWVVYANELGLPSATIEAMVQAGLAGFCTNLAFCGFFAVVTVRAL